MKILFLVPYPTGEAPSQRFRFEQYFPLLKRKGISFDIQSFLDIETWKVLYQRGRLLQKTSGTIKGFIRRFAVLFRMGKYDFVFIHREVAPVGPPFFELIISKVMGKKMVYDFDDAIWLPNVSSSNKFISKLKWYSKVENICRWSYKISCGNDFLKEYALRFNANAIVNPTTIDTENLHNQIKNQQTEKVVIGWTGTHSTVGYLNDILPVIKEIEDSFDIEFCVISNRKPDFVTRSLKYIEWKKESEIEDLMRFNIGIMPMPVNEWTQGKCGFKILQYMALGIPAVASPLEVNKKIIDHGLNGFLCQQPQEWIDSLKLLVADAAKRADMGKSAREKIIHNFSVTSNAPNFLSLFE